MWGSFATQKKYACRKSRTFCKLKEISGTEVKERDCSAWKRDSGHLSCDICNCEVLATDLYVFMTLKIQKLLFTFLNRIIDFQDMITERLHRNEELSDLCCDTFLCECWSLYLRLVVVCHLRPSKELPGEQTNRQETEDLFDSSACVLKCLEWASR